MTQADSMAAKATRWDIVGIDEQEQKAANNSRGCVEIVTSTRRAMTAGPYWPTLGRMF
jgi:hypothetical protein